MVPASASRAPVVAPRLVQLANLVLGLKSEANICRRSATIHGDVFGDENCRCF